MFDQQTGRYCPLRTDLNGEMAKCVVGCAWYSPAGCAMSMLAIKFNERAQAEEELTGHIQDLLEAMERTEEYRRSEATTCH